MSLQGFFLTKEYEIYGLDGELKASEKIHITRQSNSNTDFAHSYKFRGLLADDTVIATGDLVQYGEDKLLVTAFRHTDFMNTNTANMWLCDTVCSIYRVKSKFVGNQKAGVELVPVIIDAPCVQRDTNGKMKYYDAGLLESTTKLVYLQNIGEVELTDRLVIDGQNYQVDSISTSIKNVLTLQLSPDKRALQ